MAILLNNINNSNNNNKNALTKLTACSFFYKEMYPRFQGENLDKNKAIFSRIEGLAGKHQCTPAQLALAWVLQKGDDIVPIPGNWLFLFSFSESCKCFT